MAGASARGGAQESTGALAPRLEDFMEPTLDETALRDLERRLVAETIPATFPATQATSAAAAAEAPDSMGAGAAALAAVVAPVATAPARCPAAPAVQGNRYLSKAIRREARRIENLGEYIGMFELATWSALRQRDVILIQGTECVSLQELFAETLGDCPGRAPSEMGRSPATIAGCAWGEEAQDWVPVHDPVSQPLKHYVVAARIPGSAAPPLEGAVPHRRLDVQLGALGYVMIPTEAAGDCGIEALRFFEADGAWGDFGSHVSWRALRRELAAHMRERSREPRWQALFSACAEECRQGAAAAEAEAQEISSSDAESQAPLCSSSEEEFPPHGADDASSISSIGAEEWAAMWSAFGFPEGGLAAESLDGALPEKEVPAAPPVAAPSVGAAAPAPVAVVASAPLGAAAAPAPVGAAAVAAPVGAVASAPVDVVASAPAGVVASAPVGAVASAPAPVGAPVAPVSVRAVAAAPAPVDAVAAAAPSQAPEVAEGTLKPCTFTQFVLGLPEDEMKRATANLAGFHALEDRWRAAQPEKQRRLIGTRTATGGHKNQLLAEQVKLGRAFQVWLATAEGKEATAQHRQRRAFLARDGSRREKDIPRRECMRLKRAWDLHLEVEAHLAGTWQPKPKRRRTKDGAVVEAPGRLLVMPGVKEGTAFRKCGADKTVPPHLRRRRKGGGPMRKCNELGEALWEWFVDIRHVVKARIRPSFLRKKAEALATSIVRHMRARGIYDPMPRIDFPWLRRWRRHYGVSLVLPGKRFKLSRARLAKRLKVMWMGNLRVRLLALATLQRELVAWGVDQKPLYLNESGSKNMPALSIAGEVLELKENTAHTRTRISAMTTVTSDKEEAKASTLPLELLFKANTDGRGPKGILRPLEALETGCNMSFQTGPKGSYRLEHVLRFLDKHLPHWTEERRRKLDWRLLYLDAYAAHLAEEVRTLAWERGFVVRIHGAGTTGDVQVNDTHLHAPFAHKYREMETEALVLAQEDCPGDISRRREDVVTDAALTWRALDHTKVAEGHLRNGLTNALDGSQDEELSDVVKGWWAELGLYEARDASRQEIFAKVAAGELCWDVASIGAIDPGWGDAGVGAYAREGQELDEVAAEGEALCLPDSEPEGGDTDVEAEDRAREREERRRLRLRGDAGVAPHEIGGVLVPADPADTEAELQAARAFAAKRAELEQVIAVSSKLHLLPTVAHAQRRLKQHLRSAQAGADSNRKVAWRYWQAAQEAEREAMAKMRQRNLKAKRKLQKEKTLAAAIKRRAQTEKLARERKREEEAKQRELEAEARSRKPRDWEPKLLGQGLADGGKAPQRQARAEFLDRMRILFPLPPDLEEIWPDFRERFPRFIGQRKDKAVGHFLLQAANAWEEAAEAAAGGKKQEAKVLASSFPAFVRKWHKTMGPRHGAKRM